MNEQQLRNVHVPLKNSVRAEGDLDSRGTSEADKQAPVGFKEIRLSFNLDSDAGDDQLETLHALTERCCVIYQSECNPPSVKVSRTSA